MQQFLTTVLYPSLFAFLGIAGTKLWDWVKPKFQTKIDNAEARAKELENDKSQLDLTKNLLVFAKEELIESLKSQLKERNSMFDELSEKMNHLITELSRYKQLNGKI